MQFTFDENCGNETLEIKDEVYNYLIKARRHKIDDDIYFRNLKDSYIYLYKMSFIDKKKALLTLVSKEEKIVENQNKLHVGWCVVDPKTIEKYIASLNEMGVEKITFIYADYSQKNFKVNIEKLLQNLAIMANNLPVFLCCLPFLELLIYLIFHSHLLFRFLLFHLLFIL